MNTTISKEHYSINATISKVESLATRSFNIALGFDIGLEMPEIDYHDGSPRLKTRPVYVLGYYGLWKDDLWTNTFAAIIRKSKLSGDIGPELDRALTTVFAINFPKIPVKRKFKRLGDWLATIKYDREKYFGIEVDKFGRYYRIANHAMIDKHVMEAIDILTKNGSTIKGFVACLEVDHGQHRVESVYSADVTIRAAWEEMYRKMSINRDSLFRVDGGFLESSEYVRLKGEGML